MTARVSEIEEFAKKVRADGYTSAVLCGMGGSSLASQVIYNIIGMRKGSPEFFILDSTDPEAILDVQNRIDIKKTLFIIASKSGTTIETMLHYKYFYNLVARDLKERAACNFIAITDEGSSLQKLAKEKGFKYIFINPSDVGGRFSGLSYFGMVPAGLMGIDSGVFLDRARLMADACKEIDIAKNPGVSLGLWLGECAIRDIDKLTFVIQPELSSLGCWIEQLIAESTGKDGKGLIPITGERLRSASSYNKDRAFIYIRFARYINKEIEYEINLLKKSGFPVIDITLKDKMELGAEFFKWEIATCVIAAMLNIDPFDEPNVKESKDNTNRILGEFLKTGKMPHKRATMLSSQRLNEFLSQSKKNDYVAILIYSRRSDFTESILNRIRENIRERFKIATMTGYGPGYLHSTGQLFKGGPNKGLFIYLKSKVNKDLPIPGERYTFGQLKLAQESGDISALMARGRRVICITLRKCDKM